jgi:uncharacterized membrane protein
MMTRRKLMRMIDGDRIKEAIRRAELRTSGEICVSVSSLFWGSVKKAAEKAFIRLGMMRTQQRNGVLLFVVPSRRRLVVLGDSGINEKVGEDFWRGVVAKVSERFRKGDFTGGLVRGIEEIGEQLAAQFPYNPASDLDELSDALEIR